jgi:DNA-binding FadR family transcriptional regulator
VEQVINRLSAEVVDGRWPVGHKLPSVTELAATWEVGRSTVREAVQALVHRGLFRARQGAGTFVVATPAAPGADVGLWVRAASLVNVVDLYQARRAVETEAARLAAQRRTSEDLAMLDVARAAREQAAAHGPVLEWAEPDLALHRAVLAATHNTILQQLFDGIVRIYHQDGSHRLVDAEATTHTHDGHNALIAAIQASDADAAVTATVGYLDPYEAQLRQTWSREHLPARIPLPRHNDAPSTNRIPHHRPPNLHNSCRTGPASTPFNSCRQHSNHT